MAANGGSMAADGVGHVLLTHTWALVQYCSNTSWLLHALILITSCAFVSKFLYNFVATDVHS